MTARDDGGGVAVGNYGVTSFAKSGGIIYGDSNTTHDPTSTENTATSGNGHAVYLTGSAKKYNADAGPTVKLYAKCESSVWTFNGAGVAGINTDTTGTWE